MYLLFLAEAAVLSVTLPGISSPMNDYNLSLDASEQSMVFARSEADFKKARIFVANRRGKDWSKPAPISFSDQRYSDSDPWLTSDGQTLYFISDRPAPGREESRRDYDIWRVSRSATGWATPEHLGSEVNSSGQELGPELHGGHLYFASARRSGMGGLDIYSAEVQGSGFRQASLLGAPFNSAASESDFTLSADGRAAMFWRSVGKRGLIHIAFRQGESWSEPVALPSEINRGKFNFTPAFSADRARIRFASTVEREGQDSGLADNFEMPLPKMEPGGH